MWFRRSLSHTAGKAPCGLGFRVLGIAVFQDVGLLGGCLEFWRFWFCDSGLLGGWGVSGLTVLAFRVRLVQASFGVERNTSNSEASR